MSRFFYGKLALSNIKKNAQTYLPYILTCAGTIMMYYIIRSLSTNQSMLNMKGGNNMLLIMGLGSWVIGIFAVIFLFYTNSFLIKRRKKEFGLFNILGMEKRHLARVVLWESFDTFLVSMIAGILGGMLFSKLAFLGVERLLHLEIPLKFELSLKAVGEALLLFGCIFMINLVNTLRQIHLANPVELLKGGNVGEKEPKTKWIMTIVGFLFLGIGYYIAATVESPIDAFTLFFLAVILVIIGTFCLFTAGSIAVLKLMRKNRKFYYKANHFISVSGMMYRMKQNAAGLASICVLSTGVLILLSTTICLYLGSEDSLKMQHPRNMQYTVNTEEAGIEAKIKEMTKQVLEKYDTSPQNELIYYNSDLVLKQEGNGFKNIENQSFNFKNVSELDFILLDDYNRLTGQEVKLADDEVLLYVARGRYEDTTIELENITLKVKEKLTQIPVPLGVDSLLVDNYYIVLPQRDTLAQILSAFGEDLTEGAIWTYRYGFDLDLENDMQLQVYEELKNNFDQLEVRGYMGSVANSKSSVYALNGGLLFLGIFLGVLFLMATVLIIYYKQISEGYDDRERYQIMRKVGMSKKEVKASIRSQVLTIFYLPLVMAGIHIFFAFNIINRLLNLLGLYNLNLFIICTVGSIVVFGGLYSLVYGMTAKTYYKIIS